MLLIQLVLEANLQEPSSVVGLDDVFIANGTCCPMISTPEVAAKGNSCNILVSYLSLKKPVNAFYIY